MVRVLDLYCGMGGLSLGFIAGLEDVVVHGLDIDRYAVMTYNYNLKRFNAEARVQDVLVWRPRGDYDIIIGGVPCQPYSTANTKKRGREHPLYPTLPRFFDIVLELRPKAFLMENVKGLITKKMKPLLLEQLRRVMPHYRITYRVLNAAFYGVPQRRERLFVLGIRRDLDVTPELPPPTHAEKETMTLMGRLHRWITVREAIGDLLEKIPLKLQKPHWSRYRRINSYEQPSWTIRSNSDREIIIPLTPEQAERIRREREDDRRHYAKMEFPDSLDKLSRTISSHTVEGTKRETIVLPITEHILLNNKIYGYDWSKREISLDKPSYTITEKHRCGQLVSTPIMYRRLTVRECLRLQSFPDWWGFPEEISISRRYKLVGEAVPSILAYRLAVKIGELLGLKTKKPSKEIFQLPYYDRAFPTS